MRKALLHTDQRGFSLVESMLALALFSVLVLGFVSIIIYANETASLAGERVRATLLAEEGIEAVRNIRDEGFANLVDGTYGLSSAGNVWSLAGGSDTVGAFTRALTIASVDPNIKTVTSVVSWQQTAQRTGSVTLVTRLSNWIADLIGNWAAPSVQQTVNLATNSDGIKIQVSGNYAYFIRGNASPDFLIYDISNPASPTLAGSLSLNGFPQNIALSGNYAYVSSEANGEELQIIDISTPTSPALVGVYDASGNANASGVFASGTTVYLTRVSNTAAEFYVINTSTPASPTLVGSFEVGADTYEIAVNGGYAYLATANNNQEVVVVDISTPSVPIFINSVNFGGSDDAYTLAFSSTRSLLFVGRAAGDFEVLDTTSASSPVAVGNIILGDTINDISLGNNDNYAFLGSNANAAEFVVLDVSTASSPSVLGQLDLGDDLFGVAYHASLDRVFAVGADNAAEFIVLQPN